MAPRQRLLPQPSEEEMHSSHDSSSSEASTTRQPLIQPANNSNSNNNQTNTARPKLTKQASSAEDSDIARERHDFFNLIALVRAKQAKAGKSSSRGASCHTTYCKPKPAFLSHILACLLVFLILHTTALCRCGNGRRLGFTLAFSRLRSRSGL